MLYTHVFTFLRCRIFKALISRAFAFMCVCKKSVGGCALASKITSPFCVVCATCLRTVDRSLKTSAIFASRTVTGCRPTELHEPRRRPNTWRAVDGRAHPHAVHNAQAQLCRHAREPPAHPGVAGVPLPAADGGARKHGLHPRRARQGVPPARTSNKELDVGANTRVRNTKREECALCERTAGGAVPLCTTSKQQWACL